MQPNNGYSYPTPNRQHSYLPPQQPSGVPHNGHFPTQSAASKETMAQYNPYLPNSVASSHPSHPPYGLPAHQHVSNPAYVGAPVAPVPPYHHSAFGPPPTQHTQQSTAVPPNPPLSAMYSPHANNGQVSPPDNSWVPTGPSNTTSSHMMAPLTSSMANMNMNQPPNRSIQPGMGQAFQSPGFPSPSGMQNASVATLNLFLDQVQLDAEKSWQLHHTHGDTEPLLDIMGQPIRETPAKAVCCTMGNIPRTPALAARCRLPLGLHIQPLASLPPDSLSVVQPRDIVRCLRCRSYLNPYCRWIYGCGTAANEEWECSVCLATNRTAAPLDPELMQSALRYASIDYAAPVDYVQAAPKPPVYLFLLDVSRDALNTGYLALVCARLMTLVKGDSETGSTHLPGDRRTRVALMTYDAAVHFYRLDDDSLEVMLCPDLEEPYLPCAQGLLCHLAMCSNTLQHLLEHLPHRWPPCRDADLIESSRSGNALGAALGAALQLLQASGGRVFVFNATLPNKEPGSLAHREDLALRTAGVGAPAPEKVEKALGPATDFYKRLSLDFSTRNITVSFFAAGSNFMDLATLSGLSRYTGGKLFHYPGFRLPLRSVVEWSKLLQSQPSHLSSSEVSGVGSAHRLWRELGSHLSDCNVALESVMRVRAPKEITLRSFYGNTFVRSVDLLSLPTVHEDSAFSVHMDQQQEIPAHVNAICFQVALLYSSVWGERRLRVHTLRVPVAAHPELVFQAANGLAIAGMLIRFACSRSLVDVQMVKAREALTGTLQDVYRSFGDECLGGSGAASPAGIREALWAPPSLQLLALHMNALLRSKALRPPSAPISLDARVTLLSFFLSAPVHQVLLELYPQLYSLHLDTNQHSAQLCRLSTQFVDRDGIFVLYTGHLCFVLVRRHISHEVLRDLFGVRHFGELQEVTTFSLPPPTSTGSPRFNEFEALLARVNTTQATVLIVRDDGVLKDEFLAYLVDHQKAENAMSYPEFVRYLRCGFKYRAEGK